MKEKVAIITGSTSGIGKAAAELLSQEGVAVAVTGRDLERGENIVNKLLAQGSKAMFIQADLFDPETPSRLVAKVVEQWGRLDILVNNAAVVCNKPLEEIVHEDWNKLFAANLKAPFFMVQAALPWLKQYGGTVIHVSSLNGIYNDHNNLIYDTMKAALNHMTRGLALDLREEGIRCNVIMPGGTATPLINRWYEQKFANSEEANHLAEVSKKDHRVADPLQIAEAIVFLSSHHSSWINGALIPMDGGYTIGY